MNIPDNIRVNASFPFPALVQGSGPITLTKINGIWTIGYNGALLGNINTSPPLTGGPINLSGGGGTIGLAPSGVVAGPYTNANITVDVYGHVLTAANGTGGGGVGPPTVLDASTYPGATAGDQIAAALAALPATGGTVDARNVTDRNIPGFTISKSNTTIIFPIGEFHQTGSIILTGASELQCIRLIGCGSSPAVAGTGFSWFGNATDPAIVLSGVRDCECRDFYIRATTSLPLIAGIQCQTKSGANMTNNNFYHVVMFGNIGSTPNGLQKGFRWIIGPGGADVNNDVSYLESCNVFNFGQTAFSFEHGQSKSHLFVNCEFNQGQIGVDTSIGGSFKWIGGGGGNTRDADFALSQNDFSYISCISSESSNRFIRTNGSSAAGNITITGGRWGADRLNADNLVINCQFQGGVVMIGFIVDGAAVGAAPAFFQVDHTGGASGSCAIGNTIFWNPGTATSNPFQGDWNLSGNLLIDTTSSVMYRLPDVQQPNVPVTTTANYSQTNVDSTLVFNGAGSLTLTLLSAAKYQGRQLTVKTIAAQPVVSASSNVVPIAGGAAGTAILAGTAGKWATLVSDGANWVIMAGN